MKTFKDREGMLWKIDVTVSAVKRVRDLLELDLLTVTDGKLLEELADDEVMMVDLIYVLCMPEADARNITDVQFGERLVGQSIADAYTAFMEDLADFFRDPAKRRVFKALLQKQAMIETRRDQMLTEKLADPKIDAQIENALTKAGDDFTKRLESLDSTPDP